MNLSFQGKKINSALHGTKYNTRGTTQIQRTRRPFRPTNEAKSVPAYYGKIQQDRSKVNFTISYRKSAFSR